MKKVLALAAVAAVMATASVTVAGMAPKTGVNGSLHDMNMITGATQDAYGRVCVFCHTPHNATVVGLDPTDLLPLWNKEINVSGVYNAYQWATDDNFDKIGTIIDPLRGPSRLCVSCHDGSIAVDSHITAQPQAGTKFLTGARAIGENSDLSTTHPIGFSWDAALARNVAADAVSGQTAVVEIAEKTDRFATNINVNGTDYSRVTRGGGRTIGSVLFEGDIFTCASCHEVHNKENVVNTPPTIGGVTAAAPNYFLYAPEEKSLICLSCHNK